MMVTEQEAGARWCPFSRVLLPVHQAGNRVSTFHKKRASGSDVEHYAQQEADCNCLGSRCMAWRWTFEAFLKHVRADDPEAIAEPPRPASVPATWIWGPYDPTDEESAAAWFEPDEERLARCKGRCGLVPPDSSELGRRIAIELSAQFPDLGR